MSTLDSQSSLDDVRAAYADNASYQEDGSAAKCRAFMTACRLLLLHLPKRMAHGGRGNEEIEMDLTVIQAEIREARQWLAVYGAAEAAARATFSSFENFRS
jgi:hypothetical protein